MRPRLSFNIDESQKLVVIRYIGNLPGHEIVETLSAKLVSMQSPWLYDMVFDMRRFEGFVPFEELSLLAMNWAKIAQGRDKGRKVAIISEDPLIHARFSAYKQEFPTREFRVFSDFGETSAWISGAAAHESSSLAS
ncbi:MAG: hypothetical protein QM645_11880 [Asticcacaulis sp.]